MKYLFIDTSTIYLNVAIIDDNKILFNHKEKVVKDMSSRIISIIDEGFKKCFFELQDVNKIFVVNGPGSFTGLRVGVTVAKIIGYALNIDIIPLSSLEYMASTTSNKDYSVPMIDARRGNVFAGIYDSKLNNILSDQLISYELLSKKFSDSYEQISYHIENTIVPNGDILKIIHKHKHDKTVNPHYLVPNYLKLTEAEEKLNDKKNN